MEGLAILAQLLGISNALTPLIASLIASLHDSHPGLTDDEICDLALKTAAETKRITDEDRGPTP